MATSNNDQTNTTKSSHSHTLLLLLLIFLSLVLFMSISIPRTHNQYTFKGAYFKRVLLQPPVPASSTVDLHPKAPTHRGPISKRRQFGNDAHEVPSGPNPISN